MTPRWRGHEHRDLFNMINAGLGAGASDTQNQYWSGLTTELNEVDTELNKALADLKATWEGEASQSADSGMTPLQRWAGDATTGSSVMHASTVDQAEFVSTARSEMPEPVTVTTPKPSGWQVLTSGASLLTGDPGPAAQVAAQALDHEAQESAKDAAAQKAVDTMNTYESNSTWNRNTLGTFVAPPEVVVATPAPRGESSIGGPIGSAAGFGSLPGTTQNNATSSIRKPSGSNGDDGGSRTPPPPGDGFVTPPPGPGGDGGGLVPVGGGKTDPSSGVPILPTPPGSFPTPPPPPTPGPGPGPGWGPPGGYPLPGGAFPGDPSSGSSNLSNRPGGPGGPRGGGPGGLDGRGSFGGPGGAEADGGRSAAQLGRGGAGVGAPGEGVLGRGGPGGAGAPGARGGGMGGGPMGGGSSHGDEDDEHFAPDYLLETTDVFGDERMVSPAVIGEDPNTEEK